MRLYLLRDYHLHQVALSHCPLVWSRLDSVMDGCVWDAWLDFANPILLLLFLIIVKLLLKPVRRAVFAFIIKRARVAGLLALFEIKQIGRSFINYSAILFVVVHIGWAIFEAHRRWIYLVDIANGVRKILTLYFIAFGKLLDYWNLWDRHVLLITKRLLIHLFRW